MAIQNEKLRASTVTDELISVTIDATDLGVSSVDALRGIIGRYGRPLTARAFADFQQTGLSDLSVQLYQMGFALVHCPTWPNGDGTPKPIVSDIVAQDLRDQLEELEGVETFLLVATSRDYIAVANALRRHDRRVVVVAEDLKVCRELRMCADEFVALPASRAERSQEPPRQSRSTEAGRVGRSAAVRGQHQAEAVRTERTSEPVRAERAPEPVRVERAAEPTRVEKVPEPARVEAQDQVRLPSDGEVLTEVRKIIAAEGICTPRRLARALCPVDRTPTGELRSRIANRIQTLVDTGKLLRERLVVGGTSVETILTREDRNGKSPAAAPEGTSPEVVSSMPPVPAKEIAPSDSLEAIAGDVMIEGEPLSEVTAASIPVEMEKGNLSPVTDLDAFVESVLRGSEPPAKAIMEPEFTAAPEAQVVNPTAAAEPVEAAAVVPEKPKRTRSRRKSTPKVAVPVEPASAE